MRHVLKLKPDDQPTTLCNYRVGEVLYRIEKPSEWWLYRTQDSSGPRFPFRIDVFRYEITKSAPCRGKGSAFSRFKLESRDRSPAVAFWFSPDRGYDRDIGYLNSLYRNPGQILRGLVKFYRAQGLSVELNPLAKVVYDQYPEQGEAGASHLRLLISGELAAAYFKRPF